MPLVWSSPGLPIGYRAAFPAENQGYLQAEVAEVNSGTSIADGDYAGQPPVWNGTDAYAPGGTFLAPIVVERMRNVGPGPDRDLLLQFFQEETAWTVLTLGVNVTLTTFGAMLFSCSGGGTYEMAQLGQETQHLFSVNDELGENSFPVLRMGFGGEFGTEPAIAFFGATLRTVQAITGATTQDQVDSIVTALVNLGLVVDAR